MKLKQILIVPAILLLLACGGGGGGGSSTFTFTYSTDWTNRSQPGGGNSQRIRLLSRAGVLINSWIMNYTGSTIDSISQENLASGDYRVEAQLYSGNNAGGVNTGEMTVVITVDGNESIATKVGEDVASVEVTPENAMVSLPGSEGFFAAPLATDLSFTFAAPGSIVWSTFGGVGSVDADGLFQASTAGSGSVRATHNPTASIGSAAVTVNGSVPVQKKWTILVYLNAASDLYPYSILNVNQMEAALNNPDVRIVVQWKLSQDLYPSSLFNGTRRYLVQPDSSNSIASPIIQNLGDHVDMGSEQTLLEFINWAKTYYPADRYGLVLWSHGNGWRRSNDPEMTRAVSYDDQTNNAIQIWELADGFANNHFEFVAFDASLMQMVEVAYEIKDKTDYVIGSEESPPGEGYPYTPIVAAFSANPGATTQNLTKSFVDAMVNEPNYVSRKITQSVLRSSDLPNLASKLDTLAFQMILNAGTLTSAITNARNTAQSYSQTSSPPRFYRDAYDLCLKLEAGTSNVAVDAAAADVRAAINQAVIWEGHNSNSPGSHGVSIDFTPGTVFLSSSTDYARMLFGQDTQWDDFLAIAP